MRGGARGRPCGDRAARRVGGAGGAGLAGLPTDRFFFEGFLPAKEGQRKSRIAELARIPATLILFESGPRIAGALADLAAGLGGREAAVCRELTKLHEEVRRGDLAELAQAYADGAETRGEIVIVDRAARGGGGSADDGEVDALLRGALERASVKDAVSEVAAATGRPRREIYQRALALTEESDDGDERRVARMPEARRRGPSAWPRSASACRRKAAPPRS